MNKYCVVCNKGKVPHRLPKIIPIIESHIYQNHPYHQHHNTEVGQNMSDLTFRRKLLQISGTSLQK